MEEYVVCVGLATRDTVLAVPHYPARDGVVLASDLAVAGGGPAATAAVTLARLGVRAFFIGTVGDDDAGAFIRDGLERERVDVGELAVVEGGISPQSSILVDERSGARAIAAYRGRLPPLQLSEHARALCAAAAWVHVDQTGYPPVARLRHQVHMSVDGGNPIDDLSLDGVALYAPTEAALRESYGSARAALDAGAEVVVATRGAEGSVAYTRDGGVVEAPGYHVDAVSTLGAGDVFHGALLAQLVRKVAFPEALRFANACAALSCRALDGRSAIPTAEELAP